MSPEKRREPARSNTIARKLVSRLILFGVLLMVVSSLVSLGIAYVGQRRELTSELERIADAELEPLTEALWVYNREMLRTHLAGLSREPELAYLVVRDQTGPIAAAGRAPADAEPTRIYALRFRYNDTLRELGELLVYADDGQVFRAALSLGLYGSIYPVLSILAAGAFLYFTFHRMVVSRVLDITAYLRTFNTEYERRSLVFDSAPLDTGRYDELDEVATAINSLRDSLNARHAQLLDANRRSEREVEEKTRELKQKVDDLERTRAQLTEANAAKTRFLANMSHEVRTPITGVMGLARVLARSDLDGEQRSYARAIEDSGRSLLGIVDDLLDFSKLEDGRIDLADGEIDIRQAVDSTANLVRHTDRGGGVPIRIEIAEGVPARVRGDQVRLQQVLHNLLGNAVKFTAEGEIVVRVEPLGAAHTTGSGTEAGDGADSWRRVRFSVSDTGIGIPQDRLSRIFDSFYQVDSSYGKRYEGTGLGLAISRQLVELMGGEIHVDSAEGRGSTFRFELPVEVLEVTTRASGEADEPEEYVVGTAATESETAGGTTGGARVRVLVAEDNAINRMYMEKFLEREGHDVSTAADGNAVLEVVAQAAFDIILMDIQMPGLDGMEAARRIRTHSDVPIVALTAYARDDEIQTFLDAGMNAVVTKPIQEYQLRRTIRELSG